MEKTVKKLLKFNKIIQCPPDKSITHRAIMFSAISGGGTIFNPLLSEDCLNSLDCMSRIGADFNMDKKDRIIVKGFSLKSANLDAGNSGTTMRLLTGYLAAQNGSLFTFSGDESLKKRPMNRILQPLELMGGVFKSSSGCAPLNIFGARLKGINYTLPIPSAQVKSSILLAGLYASGKTSVKETIISRDHTEKMLRAMDCDITVEKTVVTVRPSVLTPIDMYVGGDISSAAYAMVLALLIKGGRVLVKNVCVNPTRTGILEVFDQIGASYRLLHIRQDVETLADIEVEYTENMKPFNIGKEILPRLIDEVPILAVLASFIDGVSIISGAEELKVKETNRIDAMEQALKILGVDIKATVDGLIIKGNVNNPLKMGTVQSYGDHRIAMSMTVAGCVGGGVKIKGGECVAISFPHFYELID